MSYVTYVFFTIYEQFFQLVEAVVDARAPLLLHYWFIRLEIINHMLNLRFFLKTA